MGGGGGVCTFNLHDLLSNSEANTGLSTQRSRWERAGGGGGGRGARDSSFHLLSKFQNECFNSIIQYITYESYTKM